MFKPACAMMANGVSITGPVSARLEVLLSSNAGQLARTILDRHRNPVRNVEAVLIPNDRALHDFYRTAISDSNRKFSIRSIVPGDRLFAWEDIEPYAYRERRIGIFCVDTKSAGVPVRVSDPEKKTWSSNSFPRPVNQPPSPSSSQNS
jgi:hypothetical protein